MNYTASARSNYFKVRDVEAFEEWAKDRGLEVVEADGSYALLGGDGDTGGWPSSVYDEDQDTDLEIDVALELSRFLEDGEVAILVEVGNEGLRSLNGYAEAINNRGETRFVSLRHIFELAKELGPNVDQTCL